MSDPTTQSNHEAIATTDVELNWCVDFDTRTISGSVIHRLEVLAKDGVDKVIFDTSDLDVNKVEVKIGEKASEDVQFSLGDPHPVMGSALTISLGHVHHGSDVRVKVTYKTRESKALQWLDPQKKVQVRSPRVDRDAEASYALAARWDASRETDVAELDFSPGDVANWDTNQIIVFLERLQSETIQPLPRMHVDHLGVVYGLTHTLNAELRMRFYQVALREVGAGGDADEGGAARAYARDAAQWVVGADDTGVVKGRMKFCRPVLRAVASVDRALAVRVYEEHREAFHPIARQLIEKDLRIYEGGV